MKSFSSTAFVITALIATIPQRSDAKELQEFQSSSELVASLPNSAWRALDADNTIVMTLDAGEVIIELAPGFAPQHTKNIKQLVHDNYFDGTAVIRSQDNYVAQWGDTSDVGGKPKPLGKARQKVEVEFFRKLSDIAFTGIESRDAYAQQVGFSNGLPTANDGEQAWLAHCYGMVGVSRGMGSDSGNGSGLYAVTGHSPRHLDLNVTLVGKVWKGMKHLSSLPRGTGDLGFYEKPEQYAVIRSVRMLEKGRKIDVMKTNSPEFKRFVELRTTRNEEWFLRPTGKIELCNVWVPTRENDR